MRSPILGAIAGLAIVLAMFSLALPQREFQAASGADRGATVYGISHLADFLATTCPAGRERGTGGPNAVPCAASVGMIPDALNWSRDSILHRGDCADSHHSRSILTLQRRLLI